MPVNDVIDASQQGGRRRSAQLSHDEMSRCVHSNAPFGGADLGAFDDRTAAMKGLVVKGAVWTDAPEDGGVPFPGL